MPAIPNNPTAKPSVVSVNSSLVTPTSVNGLSADTRTLNGLKSQAATDPKGAAREAAKQFETLFMGELVKSMRVSTQPTGTEMLDQQLAGQVSGRPGGLAEALYKQLERQMGMAASPVPVASSGDTPAGSTQRAKLQGQPTPGVAAARTPQTGAAGFVQQHMAAAREAEQATGIPAPFMVSQAALETGWGRKEIKLSDGTPSFNLFGIKAGGSWKGPVAEVPTTEFIDGKPTRVMAKFRAYGSYAESFSDYATLMSNSPRYQGVVKAVLQARAAAAGAANAVSDGAMDPSATARKTAAPASAVTTRDNAVRFAQNMQRAGYATDPEYADKLSRVINTTLRLQRSLVA
jgi:peptidoglycan hydrolase FlgJ